LFDGADAQGAFFLGALGAVHAALGDGDAADNAFEVAARRLRDRPALSTAVALLQRAAAVQRSADAARPAASRAVAEEARAAAALAERSEELRLVLRLIDDGIDADG
jgi:hypothetical protein